MKKLNRLVAQAVLCLGVVAPFALSADACPSDCCEPCEVCPSDCDCCTDVTIDFLFWKPCVDELDFAAISTSDSNETLYTYHGVDPKWQAGVRIELSKPNMCCGWGTSASYTFVTGDTSDSISHTSATIFDTNFHPNLDSGTAADYLYASGKFEFHYHAFDALLSHTFAYGKCHSFMPYFGLQGLVLDQKFTSQYRDAAENYDQYTSEWNSEFLGAGLKLGTEYTYTIYDDCLSFFVNASGAIVGGESSSDVKFTVDTSGADAVNYRFKDDENCIFLNNYHYQVGLLYDWALCGCDTSIRLGYEYVKWTNTPTQRRFVNEEASDIARSTSANVTTFGFHGLFAGLEMKY